MLAPRGFQYKHSQNRAHRLAARDSPVHSSLVDANTSPEPSTAPSAAKTTTPPAPPTSVASAETTAVAPTTSSFSAASVSSAPAPSSSSPPSALTSASASTSSTSTSSPTARTSSPTASTPLALASTPTLAASVSNPVITGIQFSPTSSLSPSTTSSAGSSGGTNTSTIVGGVVGALVGIAILGTLLMWCMRRQRNRDVDDFDARAFKRQSAILVDDPDESSRSYNPRPPTMIEHHSVSPALAAQGGYGGQNFYGSYGGYGQQPQAPSEMTQPVRSPPPQAYGAPPMGYTGYDSQQQLARQPSNAAYLTRQPNTAAGYTLPTAHSDSLDPNAHYIDLNRSSVSPYQAVQYADISRQLGTSNPNTQPSRESSHFPEGPLPSPFDDAEATPVRGVPPHIRPPNVSAPGPVSATPAPETHGDAAEAHRRPATPYGEDEAYDGF